MLLHPCLCNRGHWCNNVCRTRILLFAKTWSCNWTHIFSILLQLTELFTHLPSTHLVSGKQYVSPTKVRTTIIMKFLFVIPFWWPLCPMPNKVWFITIAKMSLRLPWPKVEEPKTKLCQSSPTWSKTATILHGMMEPKHCMNSGNVFWWVAPICMVIITCPWDSNTMIDDWKTPWISCPCPQDIIMVIIGSTKSDNWITLCISCPCAQGIIMVNISNTMNNDWTTPLIFMSMPMGHHHDQH